MRNKPPQSESSWPLDSIYFIADYKFPSRERAHTPQILSFPADFFFLQRQPLFFFLFLFSPLLSFPGREQLKLMRRHGLGVKGHAE